MTQHLDDDLLRRTLLQRLGALEGRDAAPFESLVLLAAAVCGCPMAMFNVADGPRLRVKAGFGVSLLQAALAGTLCEKTLALGETLFVMPDASQDRRFREQAWVAGPPGLRFYAGRAVSVEGIAIGTLCVMDPAPRAGGLEPQQQDALRGLADVAGALLGSRRPRPDDFVRALARQREALGSGL